MKNNAHLQRTIKSPVSFVGTGLHSGTQSRITLKPCMDGSGIFFRRKDVPAQHALIAARWFKVSDTTLSTVLSNSYGTSISTVEHLMAALRICQIDNLEIEVYGSEIPIMDGSAKPFVEMLMSIGTQITQTQQKVICINKTVEVSEGDQYALLVPDNQARITVAIEFKEKAIGSQSLSVRTSDAQLRQTIAPARTFGFLDQVEQLQNNGLALGGSLKNAILVDDDQVVNAEGLRFEDEFVRHKILDAIGDLALIGFPIMGHYHAFKGGHLLNKRLINKLIKDKSAWSLLTLDEFYQIHGQPDDYYKPWDRTQKNPESFSNSILKTMAKVKVG